VQEKELKKGDRNRATLAVARRLVAYMMSVDKKPEGFRPVRGAKSGRGEKRTPSTLLKK